MKTLTFATKEEAEARSREEWEKVLGRPKNKADVTEFLWPVVEEEGAAKLLIPAEDEARLTKTESASLRALSLDSGGTEILDGLR